MHPVYYNRIRFSVKRDGNDGHIRICRILEAAYSNALRLANRGNIPSAMDGLLGILREDKKFRDGEAKKIMVALLELLGDNDPLTKQYRNELASILF